MCKYSVIVSVKKGEIFSNLIAVVEYAVYFYKIYHRNLTEFSRFYKKLPCVQACSM